MIKIRAVPALRAATAQGRCPPPKDGRFPPQSSCRGVSTLIAERRTQRQEEQEKYMRGSAPFGGFGGNMAASLKVGVGREIFGESRVVLNARKSERFA